MISAPRSPIRWIEGAPEPILFTSPVRAKAALIVLHAPGENRTGNNYLFSEVARTIMKSGIATARFDLSGCGESLGRMDLGTWDRQVESAATAVVRLAPGIPVHWLARGAASALLPRTWVRGFRLALSPPGPQAVTKLALHARGHEVVGSWPCAPAEARLWQQIGAEPNLIGGLTVPVRLLRQLSRRLEEEPRWDLELSAAGGRSTRPRVVVAAGDPLLRLEASRAGFVSVLSRLLLDHSSRSRSGSRPRA